LRLHAVHRPVDRAFPDPVVALVALVARVARVAGVLDLEWTRDAELLRARLDRPVDTAGDVVLTAVEGAAYEWLVTRFNQMWALGDPVEHLIY